MEAPRRRAATLTRLRKITARGGACGRNQECDTRKERPAHDAVVAGERRKDAAQKTSTPDGGGAFGRRRSGTKTENPNESGTGKKASGGALSGEEKRKGKPSARTLRRAGP
jgi:hypothetical protein